MKRSTREILIEESLPAKITVGGRKWDLYNRLFCSANRAASWQSSACRSISSLPWSELLFESSIIWTFLTNLCSKLTSKPFEFRDFSQPTFLHHQIPIPRPQPLTLALSKYPTSLQIFNGSTNQQYSLSHSSFRTWFTQNRNSNSPLTSFLTILSPSTPEMSSLHQSVYLHNLYVTNSNFLAAIKPSKSWSLDANLGCCWQSNR
jgi:hypothetical protein